jgi:Tfp pilus assembly major pilin PilA
MMLFKRTFLTTALAALVALSTTVNGLAIEYLEKRQDASTHWVTTWTSMPQLVESNNMPPSPFVSNSPILLWCI